MIQKILQSPMVWAVTLCIVVLGFFYQTFIGGKLPVPADTLVGLYHPWRDMYAQEYPRGIPFKNFLITDPVRQQIPWRKISIESWKRGEIPTWNPYTFAGSPLAGNIQSGALYPLNILFFLFDFPIAWTLLIVVQPLLAALFMYIYLRHHKVIPIASFFGALVWSFCGFNMSWMTWGTISQTALWIPLMLFILDHLFTRDARKIDWYPWALGFMLSFFMMMSAGHAQVAFYGVLLCGAYTLWHSTHQKLSGSHIVRLLIVASLCLFVTIPLWFPQTQVFSEAVRNQGIQETREGWFLPWAHLVQFVAPDFFGNPATLNYWGTWNYGEFIGYIGVVALVLAISVMWRTRELRFWTITAIVALFFMLDHPITRFLGTVHIPLFGSMQPTRLMVAVDLALAILAAFGMNEFLAKKTSIYKSLLFIGGVYAVLWVIVLGIKFVINDTTVIEHFVVAKRNLIVPSIFAFGTLIVVLASGIFRAQRNAILGGGLVLLVMVDLFRFGWKFTPFTPQEYFFPTTKVVEFLASQPKPFRVLSLDDRILPPNVSSFYGIETIEGYDPLVSRRFDNFLAASEQKNSDVSKQSGFNRIYTAHNLSSPLVAFMNVRYVLALTDISDSNLHLVFQEGQTRVYKNDLFLPRVYFADSIKEVPLNAQEELKGLFDGPQSRAEAVVWVSVPVLSVPFSSDESIHIDSYEANRIRISTRTVSPRFVVVLNSFSPTLRAYIDGKITPVYRTNFMFTGVVVPTGKHTVTLTYGLW